MATDIGPRIGLQGEREFRRSIEAVNAQMKALGAEMKAVTAEFAGNASSQEALAAKNAVLGRSVEAAKNKLSVLDGQLDRQKSKLQELAEALEKASEEFGKTSKEASAAQNAYNKQSKAVSDLERQYQTARAQLAGFESDLSGAGQAAERAGDAIGADAVLAGNAAWAALQASVRAVTGAMEEAVQVGMAFDSEVSNLAATMGQTVGQVGELRQYAKEMGADTIFTAKESAQGLIYLAQAGKDAEESMLRLPTTLALASAGGISLASSTNMVVDAQSALRLSGEQTDQLIDQMAQTATKTNTAVAELGEAILTVGGTAQFLSGGTAEINQVLGVLADNSIKGAEGGTKLRNVILSLSSPTEKAAKTLDDLGVSVFDAEGNLRAFSEIFPEMQKSLSTLTDQEQIAALGEIFNSRDIAAAQALLGTTAERWDELAAAIDGAQGSAQRMAETRLDNLAGDLTLFQSAADGARIALSDSLTPALRDVVQAGTGIMTFVGGFIDEVPLAGQALAGLAAAGVTLGVGMAASAAGITTVTGAVTALTAAMAANPFGQIAIAVGAGVTALTALAHAADEAGKKTTAAAQAVEDSRAAWEETAAAAAAEKETILDLAAQLEDLAGREERTAGEKERLLVVTEQLNQAVPGLGLEYDALTDSLSMTTEQILELARAQADLQERQAAAEAVVKAEQVHAQAVRDLEQAQRDLAAAISARNDAERAGMAMVFNAIEEMGNLNQAVRDAEKTVSELEQAVQDSEGQVAEMTASLEELADSAGGVSGDLGAAGTAAQGLGAAAALAAADLEALEGATLAAAETADVFADALSEQERAGSLSLETAQELIAAGYESALVIDAETGAVTLNREEYVRLAGAKIQAQIATLELQRASLQAADDLAREKMAAEGVTSAYWDAAGAKAAMAHADDIQALELQIAALRRAQKSLEGYGESSTSAARQSSSSSRQIKTQAQRDLAAYKELQSELEHEQAMGLLSEAEYYRRLTELRDQYLSDAGNIEEYRKVSESIYKADQKALAEREKLWQSASDNILKAEESFQQELAGRASEIAGSYKLFDQVPEKAQTSAGEILKNLEAQYSSIESFYSNLAALGDRGVSAGLVEEIRGMGVQAAGELEALLAGSDETLEKLSQIYEDKQRLANDIALEELEELRKSTNDEILGQLEDVAALYDQNGPALGLAFANSLAEGMFEGMPAVEAMAQTVARAAMSAFDAERQGLEGLMVRSGGRSVSRDDIGELLAGAVSGIQAAESWAGGYQPTDVTLVINDRVLAEVMVEPMRAANRANPETLDDT